MIVNDEEIIFKYFSENITENTKQSLVKAFHDIRIQTRAEGWVKIDNTVNPPEDVELLLVLDLSDHGTKPFICTGTKHFSQDEIAFGSVHSIIDYKYETGLSYYRIEGINYPTKYITHYQLKPELPND